MASCDTRQTHQTLDFLIFFRLYIQKESGKT